MRDKPGARIGVTAAGGPCRWIKDPRTGQKVVPAELEDPSNCWDWVPAEMDFYKHFDETGERLEDPVHVLSEEGPATEMYDINPFRIHCAEGKGPPPYPANTYRTRRTDIGFWVSCWLSLAGGAVVVW